MFSSKGENTPEVISLNKIGLFMGRSHLIITICMLILLIFAGKPLLAQACISIDIRANIGVPSFYSYTFSSIGTINLDNNITLDAGIIIGLYFPIGSESKEHFALISGFLYTNMQASGWQEDYVVKLYINWQRVPIMIAYALINRFGILYFGGGVYFSMLPEGYRNYDDNTYTYNVDPEVDFNETNMKGDFGLHFEFAIMISFNSVGNYPVMSGFGAGITLDISLSDPIIAEDESFHYWGFGFYLSWPFFIPF